MNSLWYFTLETRAIRGLYRFINLYLYQDQQIHRLISVQFLLVSHLNDDTVLASRASTCC